MSPNTPPDQERGINSMTAFMSLLFVMIPTLLSGGSAYLYGQGDAGIIKASVLTGTAFLAVSFSWYNQINNRKLSYDNSDHPERFFLIALSGVVFSCILPLFPSGAWPLMPFAIALSILGSRSLGVLTYGCTLMIPTLLMGADAGSLDIFFMYFVPGCISIMLLPDIDEDFKVGFPVFISHLFLFLCECACTILNLNERLSIRMFFLPAINVCICMIITYLILRLFCFRIIRKDAVINLGIADPEHSLMLWLKQNSPEDYYHAVHTAYFSERIASKTGADKLLAKAGAYYQNIARVRREKLGYEEPESVVLDRICLENNIPDPIRNILTELLEKNYVSRESTMIMFSDAVVTSVKYLMKKHPGQLIDYGKVVDMIIQRKKDNGTLKNSLIAINDIDTMRDVFVKEDLYYDFLRADN